ncbi:MAG TPA: NAD(P)/FAD-dependent oxidoreductase [Anaerolineae bacterium]|nr:NAD(P)/FAD-dependent oxidoreductase [Anaerolineae bacterium]
MTRYVIVGNGIAGVTAAQAIARADGGADLHIYGSEPTPYYRRPQLPAYIAGEVAEKDLLYRPLAWYEQRGIHVHLDSPVAELDPAAHQVRLADGSAVPYDRLLLATGGWAWTPPVEGVARRGFFTLRTLKDARAIRALAPKVRKALVIGGGLLGLEGARALRMLGLEVTVLEFADHLMPRQLDREGAAVLEGILREMGVRVLTGVVTEAVLGDGTVAGVRLKDGRELPAGLILCSAGMRPDTALARQAGLTVGRGVVVDERMATGSEDVYAAGDVAEAGGIVYGIIPAAIEQARVAAANMVHPGSAVYTGTLATTTLKVVGAELTSLGECVAEDEGLLQLRYADPAAGRYRKLALRGGRVVGAILLNDRERVLPARRLIERGTDVSAHIDWLLDTDFDLGALVATTGGGGDGETR